MSSRIIVEGFSMRTSAILLPVLAFSSGLVQAAERQLFDMDAIRDASTLGFPVQSSIGVK